MHNILCLAIEHCQGVEQVISKRRCCQSLCMHRLMYIRHGHRFEFDFITKDEEEMQC